MKLWALALVASGGLAMGCGNVSVCAIDGSGGAGASTGEGGATVTTGTTTGTGGTGGSGGAAWPPPGTQAEVTCAQDRETLLGDGGPVGERARLALPDGAFLLAVYAEVTPKTGHAALPGSMPSIVISRTANADPSMMDTLGIAVDASATVADYEQQHKLSASTVGDPIDAVTWKYSASGFYESGDNAIHGGSVTDWRCVLAWGH